MTISLQSVSNITLYAKSFSGVFRVAWRSLHGLLETANDLQEYFMANKEKIPT